MTLFTNYYETAAVILFGIGLTTLLLHKNMIKKIMGFNIMDTGDISFFDIKRIYRGTACSDCCQ